MVSLSIPGFSVTFDSYQWSHDRGRQFGSRNEGVSDYGVLHRELTGTIQRKIVIRFAQIDTKLEALRTLALRAGRNALPVTFTDLDGTSWPVDWPEANEFHQMLENRREITLDLLQQSAGT